MEDCHLQCDLCVCVCVSMAYFKIREKKTDSKNIQQNIRFSRGKKKTKRGLKLSQKVCREAWGLSSKGPCTRKHTVERSPPHTQVRQCWEERDGGDKAHSDILFTDDKYSLVHRKVAMNDVLAPERGSRRPLTASPSPNTGSPAAAQGIAPDPSTGLCGESSSGAAIYSLLVLNNLKKNHKRSSVCKKISKRIRRFSVLLRV